MATPAFTQLANIPSVVDDNDKLILRGRVKTPKEVISDYRSLFTDDWYASRDRAVMQSMVDGNPPFSDARDRMIGMFGRTNVNWGLLTQAQQEAEQPFNDILDSLDNFGIVPIRYGVVTETEASLWEPIIAEELHRTITQWKDFYFSWWLNAHFFTMWGVSFTFRDDTLDWRWKVTSMQELKLPRGTQASIEKFDRICCKVDMAPSDLYAKIKDPEAGAAAGWNKAAIVAACKNAHPTPVITDNPEELQAMWKDNAIYSGMTNLVVEVVHMWVKELDGSISHYIAEYDSKLKQSTASEFIYKKEGEYENMSQLVNAYLYGVGTNGDLHSIRGNSYALFPAAQAINRLMCKMIDKCVDESNTYIAAENEDAIQDQAIFPRGPYMQVTNGVSFVERKTPPVAGNLVPALSAMREIFAIRSSGMAPRASSINSADKGQKTAYELQRKDEMDSTLSSAVMNLFFRAWGNDYREIVRRLINPALTEAHPGGREALEFRRRCEQRGVPWEVLQQLDLDNIQLNMGIGRGSSAERRATLGVLNGMIDRFDQAGQMKVTRDTVAAYTNMRYALEIVPVAPGTRPPVDFQIANMENQMFMLGSPATVVPNQDHVTHVADHISLLAQLNGQIEQVQMELQEAIPLMQQVQAHCTEHMGFISVENENYPQFKEALQQFNEVIVNGAKHIEAEDRQRQKAEAEGAAPPESEGTPAGILIQAADARARLETQQQKNALMAQAGQQKLAINDLMGAQKIKQQAAKHQLEMQKMRDQMKFDKERHTAELERMKSKPEPKPNESAD